MNTNPPRRRNVLAWTVGIVLTLGLVLAVGAVATPGSSWLPGDTGWGMMRNGGWGMGSHSGGSGTMMAQCPTDATPDECHATMHGNETMQQHHAAHNHTGGHMHNGTQMGGMARW